MTREKLIKIVLLVGGAGLLIEAGYHLYLAHQIGFPG